MICPRIIGLSAKIKCGKTTYAEELLKIYPSYVIESFGNNVKKEVSDTYNIPMPLMYSQEGKEEIVNHDNLPLPNMTVREVMQWHGTDYRREQDTNYWIKYMMELTYDKFVIIDDVRFINEAQLVNDNGILIRVNPHENWEVGPFSEHRSETELDDYEKFDLVLEPKFNGIKEAVDTIIQFIKK